MTSGGDSVLSEIVRRLVIAYRPERIYLFGSRGRGQTGPDSDYDLLVVVADDAPMRRCAEQEWQRTSWCGPTRLSSPGFHSAPPSLPL